MLPHPDALLLLTAGMGRSLSRGTAADLLTTIPFDWIVLAATGLQQSNSTQAFYISLLRLLRMGRAYRLRRWVQFLSNNQWVLAPDVRAEADARVDDGARPAGKGGQTPARHPRQATSVRQSPMHHDRATTASAGAVAVTQVDQPDAHDHCAQRHDCVLHRPLGGVHLLLHRSPEQLLGPHLVGGRPRRCCTRASRVKTGGRGGGKDGRVAGESCADQSLLRVSIPGHPTRHRAGWVPTCSGSERQARSNATSTPCTGASSHLRPSGQCTALAAASMMRRVSS